MTETTRSSQPTNRVLATETFRIELEEADGTRGLRITNLKTQDVLELDAETNAVRIKRTIALVLEATGLATSAAPSFSSTAGACSVEGSRSRERRDSRLPRSECGAEPAHAAWRRAAAEPRPVGAGHSQSARRCTEPPESGEPALAPLKPVFDIIDTVVAVFACLKAIPDAFGPPPDPSKLVQALEDLAKKVATSCAWSRSSRYR